NVQEGCRPALDPIEVGCVWLIVGVSRLTVVDPQRIRRGRDDQVYLAGADGFEQSTAVTTIELRLWLIVVEGWRVPGLRTIGGGFTPVGREGREHGGHCLGVAHHRRIKASYKGITVSRESGAGCAAGRARLPAG